MNLLLLPPILACITCFVLAVAILGRSSQQRADRLAATLMLASGFWALCEILWGVAHDPDVVLTLVRLAALGWIPIGSLGLHLFLELTEHPAHRDRSLLFALHGISAVLVALAVFTPLVDVAVVKTSWGWGYQVGPVFYVAYAYASATFFTGLAIGVRSFRHSLVVAERRQAMVVLFGMLICMSVASVTDGLLPALGRPVPRLGVLAVTLFAALVTWGFQRYGYSLLAPGVFSSEILASLPDGVSLLRLDGIIRFANPGMERLANAAPGSLESKPIAHVISEMRGRTGEVICERECILRAVSGESIPVSVSTSVLTDKRNNPLGLVLVTRDLREVASLRRRLVVADRLAAVGQLAAGIAHEINNPVAFIRSNLGVMSELLQTVQKQLPEDIAPNFAESFDEGSDLIAESLDGIDRVAAIVRDVKGFSHAGETAPESVAIHPLLDAVLRVSAPQLPRDCRIERCYGEIPAVRGAPQELKQVFLNLVVNAAQAAREGGCIRITTGCERGRAFVVVEDEGCGIAAEQLERIFDPFFTTKAVGEGTGLGLAISYQIVDSHGGNITVESVLGVGTKFRVELPAADGPA
jgi:signal transduction histidine kinase